MRLFNLLVAVMVGVCSLGISTNVGNVSAADIAQQNGQESSKGQETTSNITGEDYDEDYEEFIKDIKCRMIDIDGKQVYIGEGTKVCKDESGRTYYSPKKDFYDVNEDYIVVDGYKLSLDGKTLLAVPYKETKCVVPEGVKELNISALYFYAQEDFGYYSDGEEISWITELTLPKSFVKIYDDDEEFFAWHRYMDIKNLTLKGTKMSAKRFSKFLRYFQTLKATDIHVPKKAGKCKKGMFIYKKHLMRYTGKAKKVIVPKGTVAISDFAFAPFYMSFSQDNDYDYESYINGNKKVTKVVLPKSVKKVGKYAFYNCKKLDKISIAKGGKIKSIGKDAFGNTKITAKEIKALR